MPTVSVIVPNYNHAAYLRQRLDSIFNQTYQDFEVIILDDCSTDNSKEIIEEYRIRPQVSHIVYNETNSGSPFKQWAKGFDLARGEYIWIAESDDWAELNFLETLIKKIKTDSSIALAYCNSIWYFDKDYKSYPTFKKETTLNGLQFIKEQMYWNNSIHNASSVLFRKDRISKVDQSYTEFKGSGDYFFWIQICETGNVFFTPNSLNYWRQHTKNTTIQNVESGNNYVENYRIFRYMRKRGYISFYKKLVLANVYLDLIKKAYKTRHNGQIDKAYKLWKSEVKSIFLSKILIKIGKIIWDLFQREKQ
ncbi:glycosyltransferase family 2 protein [Fibrobacter sp. UBA4297]|uniref:glycosyltransferase family 2 protein n=1 Tax=Fibrobacter sp. UBA4297 TaxID=1946536 RepID=UPI0025BD5DBB|nr:glycosyltransferase family 2 protein [Fibrobacter sp. UBA4297]